MNTNVSVTKSNNRKDNRIILSDKENLAWASKYFNSDELKYLKKVAKDDISFAFIPRAEAYTFVQFLKKGKTVSDTHEEARVAGNEMLSEIAHYKITSITVVNHSKKKLVLPYVEGMILGNYQFLKYFNDRSEKTNSLKSIKVWEKSVDRKSLNELLSVLDATMIARNLVNEPQSYLSAPTFSKEIKSLQTNKKENDLANDLKIQKERLISLYVLPISNRCLSDIIKRFKN